MRVAARNAGGTIARASALLPTSTMIQALWAPSMQPQSAWVRKWDPVESSTRTARAQATVSVSCGTSIRNRATANLPSSCDRRSARQDHPELRAPRPRLQLDPAAVLAHQALGDVESQPGALALRLGGEERIEDLLPDRLRHAGAIVHHPHHDLVVARLGGHLDLARLRGGLDRVGDQVRPHLVQLAAEPL